MVEKEWPDVGNGSGSPAACFVKVTMPTIWGYLEKVEELPAPAPNIQVRTVLPDGTVLRVRAKIGPQTLIARGIKPIDVSGLLKGEFVELSYSHGREGRLDAVTIYVRPEQAVAG